MNAMNIIKKYTDNSKPLSLEKSKNINSLFSNKNTKIADISKADCVYGYHIHNH